MEKWVQRDGRQFDPWHMVFEKSDITVYRLQTPVVDIVWIPDVLLGMMGGGKREAWVEEVTLKRHRATASYIFTSGKR